MTGRAEATRARTIDLNADMGESDGAAQRATDLALLGVVSSANIACGGHAGDEASMRAIASAALARGVAIGAHPGYPDRANFGRADVAMAEAEIEASVRDQVAALVRVVRALGSEARHVKAHGALYHAAARRPEVARAIGRAALAACGERVTLVGLAGSPALGVWRSTGLRVVAEAFADRRYEADGSLRARGLAGAVIDDPAEAAAQALRVARGEGVVAADGSCVRVEAGTICLHADTPGAVNVARAVREALEAGGVRVAADA